MDEIVYLAAKRRIAKIFRIDPGELLAHDVFGEKLRALFVSDFKQNEFDDVLEDIRSVTSREILKEVDSGNLVIRTVADYCHHMVRCSQANPTAVKRLLGL